METKLSEKVGERQLYKKWNIIKQQDWQWHQADQNHKDDKSAGRLVAVVITFIVYSLVKKTMKPNFKV